MKMWDSLQQLYDLVQGTGLDTIAAWAFAGLAGVLALILLPELMYWLTFRSLNKKLDGISDRLERIETRLRTQESRKEEASPLETLGGGKSTDKASDNQFPLAH